MRFAKLDHHQIPADVRNARGLRYYGSVDFLDRLFARIAVSDGCWQWTGKIDNRSDQGYGMLGLLRRKYRTHRVLWEITHGRELRPDEALCHSCDNPPCCNPAHLWVGDVAANNRDMSRKGRNGKTRRTHCPKGHPYDGENLVILPGGWRGCKACRNASSVEYKRRKTQRIA